LIILFYKLMEMETMNKSEKIEEITASEDVSWASLDEMDWEQQMEHSARLGLDSIVSVDSSPNVGGTSGLARVDDGWNTVNSRSRNTKTKQKKQQREKDELTEFIHHVKGRPWWKSVPANILVEYLLIIATEHWWDWFDEPMFRDAFLYWARGGETDLSVRDTDSVDLKGMYCENTASVAGRLRADEWSCVFEQHPYLTLASLLHGGWSRNTLASGYAKLCTSTYYQYKCETCAAYGDKAVFVRARIDKSFTNHGPKCPHAGKRQIGMSHSVQTRYYKNALFSNVKSGSMNAWYSRAGCLGSCLADVMKCVVKGLYFWVPTGFKRTQMDLDDQDVLSCVYFDRSDARGVKVSGSEGYVIQIPGFGSDVITVVNHIFLGLLNAFISMDEGLVDALITETMCVAMTSAITVLHDGTHKGWTLKLAELINLVCANSAALSHLAIPGVDGKMLNPIRSDGSHVNINVSHTTANGYSYHASAVAALITATMGRSDDSPIVKFALEQCRRYCDAVLGPIKAMCIQTGATFFKPVALAKAAKQRQCIGIVDHGGVWPEDELVEVSVKRAAASDKRVVSDDPDQPYDAYTLAEHPTLRAISKNIKDGGQTLTNVKLQVRFVDQGDLSTKVWRDEFGEEEPAKGWHRDPRLTRVGQGFQFAPEIFRSGTIIPPIAPHWIDASCSALPNSVSEGIRTLSIAKVMHEKLGASCLDWDKAAEAVKMGADLAARVSNLNHRLKSGNLDRPHVLKQTPRKALRTEDPLSANSVIKMSEVHLVLLSGDSFVVMQKEDRKTIPSTYCQQAETPYEAVRRLGFSAFNRNYVTDAIKPIEYQFSHRDMHISTWVYAVPIHKESAPAHYEWFSGLSGLTTKSIHVVKKVYPSKYPESGKKPKATKGGTQNRTKTKKSPARHQKHNPKDLKAKSNS
jgi:hypothetical protein